MIKETDVNAEDITVEENTPGGTTYYLKRPDSKNVLPVCWRHIRNQEGMRCENAAGQGTEHVGYGACRFHGGMAGNKYRTSGRATKIERYMLEKKVQEYMKLDRKTLLDLTEELAITKALFSDFVEKSAVEPDDDKYGVFITRYQNMIKTLAHIVDKISTIDNRNAITAAQVMYLKSVIVDILMKYVTDPYNREQAARELSYRFGNPGEIQDNHELLEGNFVESQTA